MLFTPTRLPLIQYIHIICIRIYLGHGTAADLIQILISGNKFDQLWPLMKYSKARTSVTIPERFLCATQDKEFKSTDSEIKMNTTFCRRMAGNCCKSRSQFIGYGGVYIYRYVFIRRSLPP